MEKKDAINNLNSGKTLIWTDRLLINDTTIDNQHKYIFKTINEILINKDYISRPEKGAELLTKLINYSIDHFKTEIKHMKDHSYPHIEEHQVEHDKYLRKIVEFNKYFIRREYSAIEQVVEFLTNWWKDHIMTMDMKYSNYIRNI